MNRRSFLKQAAVLAASASGADRRDEIDLRNCVVVTPEQATAREKKAITVLVEEVERRSALRLTTQTRPTGTVPTVIYAGTRRSIKSLGPRVASISVAAQKLAAEGYIIQSGSESGQRWIAVVGADERGLLFGVGKLLRLMTFGRQTAAIDARNLGVSSAPKYPLRGHQLGYRPKTNAYDAWNVATWHQYIRDLAVFGTNAIELIPPRSDDEPDSPHFPLPPEQMMIEMSRIADEYGLDVWIWYPAMDANYAEPATVEAAVKEWAHIFEILPRIDAVFIPGGDPGHAEPKVMPAFLEKQKASLRRFHPKAQMWISPQGFRESWMNDFFGLLGQQHTTTWLDGIVFGPQSRLNLPDLRQRVPKRYPIRFYPDITHSVACQYPVPDWDVAFALTEGRECINPRPVDQANILRRMSPSTIGFITYSEGCNDDVNKFFWSSLGWDPEISVVDALREYAQYFLGHTYADNFAQGLLALEQNWRGALATNDAVSVTLARFEDMERSAPPAVLENWRFQQALYRAYYDAAVRSRLLDEGANVERALDTLGRVNEIGWAAEPLEISGAPSPAPPNGQDPGILLDAAERTLSESTIAPAGAYLRGRVRELGEALLQSIQMQLAVNRYQGEAVVRGANLETLETPVTDIAWLRAQIASIRKISGMSEQVRAIQQLLRRTDPGPGGFYDELGNPANRPHLVLGQRSVEDPEYRRSALTGFSYPDRLGNQAPMAWKRWAESLFDAALEMNYSGLDPEADYRIRVVYSGDARKIKIRLVAGQTHEIHPFIARPWPPQPLEFDIPAEAISGGNLRLSWTREQGLGGNGRGCQVSEVWIMKR